MWTNPAHARRRGRTHFCLAVPECIRFGGTEDQSPGHRTLTVVMDADESEFATEERRLRAEHPDVAALIDENARRLSKFIAWDDKNQLNRDYLEQEGLVAVPYTEFEEQPLDFRAEMTAICHKLRELHGSDRLVSTPLSFPMSASVGRWGKTVGPWAFDAERVGGIWKAGGSFARWEDRVYSSVLPSQSAVIHDGSWGWAWNYHWDSWGILFARLDDLASIGFPDLVATDMAFVCSYYGRQTWWDEYMEDAVSYACERIAGAVAADGVPMISAGYKSVSGLSRFFVSRPHACLCFAPQLSRMYRAQKISKVSGDGARSIHIEVDPEGRLVAVAVHESLVHVESINDRVAGGAMWTFAPSGFGIDWPIEQSPLITLSRDCNEISVRITNASVGESTRTARYEYGSGTIDVHACKDTVVGMTLRGALARLPKEHLKALENPNLPNPLVFAGLR